MGSKCRFRECELAVVVQHLQIPRNPLVESAVVRWPFACTVVMIICPSSLSRGHVSAAYYVTKNRGKLFTDRENLIVVSDTTLCRKNVLARPQPLICIRDGIINCVLSCKGNVLFSRKTDIRHFHYL